MEKNIVRQLMDLEISIQENLSRLPPEQERTAAAVSTNALLFQAQRSVRGVLRYCRSKEEFPDVQLSESWEKAAKAALSFATHVCVVSGALLEVYEETDATCLSKGFW